MTVHQICCLVFQQIWILRKITQLMLTYRKISVSNSGLQDKIKLVAIHLQDKPAWYKEKLYPENKVHFDLFFIQFLVFPGAELDR